MTLKEAFAVAQADCTPAQWAATGEAAYKAARAVIVAAGLCPSCACGGHRSKLGRFQGATSETFAGRACLECEEFEVAAVQPRFDTCYEPDCFSDADPGL